MSSASLYNATDGELFRIEELFFFVRRVIVYPSRAPGFLPRCHSVSSRRESSRSETPSSGASPRNARRARTRLRLQKRRTPADVVTPSTSHEPVEIGGSRISLEPALDCGLDPGGCVRCAPILPSVRVPRMRRATSGSWGEGPGRGIWQNAWERLEARLRVAANCGEGGSMGEVPVSDAVATLVAEAAPAEVDSFLKPHMAARGLTIGERASGR